MYDFFYASSEMPPWLMTAALCVLIAGSVFCIYKYKDDTHARILCIFSACVCIGLLIMQFFKHCV